MAQNNNAPTSKAQVTARERENQALQMRISGANLEKIGQALGISPEGARKALKRALDRTGKEIGEGAEVLREMERQRLEQLILAAMPAASRGHIGAIEMVRKLSESLRKLLNLDLAGQRITIGGSVEIVGLQQILDRAYGSHGTGDTR